MAKLITSEFGTLLNVTDLNGNIRPDDWRNDYIGQGMIILAESENKSTGMKFMKF